jgi:hypothetical protein
MKKLILALAILAMVSVASAAEITFLWDANVEADLAGYRIYEGTVPGTNEKLVADIPCQAADNTCTTYKYIDVPDGTYYWVAFAYDTNGNVSERSEEISLTIDTIAPGNPKSFTVTINDAKKVSVSVD